MDNISAAVVKELIEHLCGELDYHYSDSELVKDCSMAIRSMQQATALLAISGNELPEIYGHVIRRWAGFLAAQDKPGSGADHGGEDPIED